MTIQEARERVAKGAAHLDVVRPGWFNRIDLGRLDLARPCACIVGQLEGSYFRGLDQVRVKVGDEESDLGFNVINCFDRRDHQTEVRQNFKTLQEAWVEVIVARKAAIVEPDLVLV